MSAFKQKARMLAVRAGLLAGASAAVLAISGVGASSAFAAAECPNNAVQNIEGKGSSLQKEAQKFWTGREVTTALAAIPHTALSPASGYANKCAQPTVSYTSLSSGAGLSAFRYTGTGTIENGNHGVSGEHTMAFVGSDDAPTPAQISNAAAVAGANNALIIPVSQTSIAIVVHPPANCTLAGNETEGLSYAELTKVWGGKEIKTWTALGATGTGCGSPIIRVVRSDTSGTTFQFKNYLAAAKAVAGGGGVNMPCSLTGFNETTEVEEATTEWAKMKAIHTAGGEPNLTWPEPGNCAETTEVKRASGGGGVVKLVAETAGSIGYASLPDAKSANNIEGKAQLAWLQDKLSPALYATPASEAGGVKSSNCGERVYEVPTSGTSRDWSKTFGAKPTVAGGLYPLCTLTYDMSWHSYSGAGYANAAAIAADTKDYILRWVLGEGGVPAWYQALPSTPTEPTHDVLGAAKAAAELIG